MLYLFIKQFSNIITKFIQYVLLWPTATYYEYLQEFYPNAKFILTVCDANKWYTSMNDTFVPPPFNLNNPIRFMLFRFSYFFDPFIRRFYSMNNKIFGDKLGGLFNFHKNKELIIDEYKKHIRNDEKLYYF